MKQSMKKILLITLCGLAFFFIPGRMKAQVLEIKTWKGTYPEMNGSYPLAFIAFKGTLIPVPHEFARLWPSHYYLKPDALQVFDGAQFSIEMQVGLLKMGKKFLEKLLMVQRHDETVQIRNNAEKRRDIGKTIFDAEFDQLPDAYRIAAGFVRLYGSIDKLNKLNSVDDCTWLVTTYRKQADDLLLRFVSINLFQTDHGEKMEAFAGIRKELNNLMGETDYTYRKVHHYQVFNHDPCRSYTFLTE
jgi:hypothetical protein